MVMSVGFESIYRSEHQHWLPFTPIKPKIKMDFPNSKEFFREMGGFIL
jgi:hypothetical protein